MYLFEEGLLAPPPQKKSEFSVEKILQVFTLHQRWCECGHAADH